MLILVMLADLSWGLAGTLDAERVADLSYADSRRVQELTRTHREVKLRAGDGRTLWHWTREARMPVTLGEREDGRTNAEEGAARLDRDEVPVRAQQEKSPAADGDTERGD